MVFRLGPLSTPRLSLTPQNCGLQIPIQIADKGWKMAIVFNPTLLQMHLVVVMSDISKFKFNRLEHRTTPVDLPLHLSYRLSTFGVYRV